MAHRLLNCSPLYAAALFSCVLHASDAEALIVVDGQIVPSWPEQEVQPPRSVAALRIGEESFYAAPRGELWGLTLLVDFSDQPPTFSVEEVRAWLDDLNYTEDNHDGGVRDYYLDVSNGVIDLRNEVFGYYRAQHPKSYYESQPGYSGAGELIEEMIDYFDDEVDFSLYDNDGDGRTESISVLYAGPSVTFGQGLWPHSGGTNRTADGVRVARYNMTQLGDALDNYVFAHETGHMVFGWPDLYGFGDYCIMGNRISTINPVGINDFFRADQGWIPTQEVDMNTPALYVARPNGTAYFYRNPSVPGELFLWSNVQDTGRFRPLDGGGLFLLHFDNRIGLNEPPKPLALAVVQADGLDQLGTTTWPSPGHDPNDYFYQGNNDEFSDATTPRASWNDGSPSGLRVHAISANGPEMTFAVGEGEAPSTPEPELDPIGGGGMGGASSGGMGGESQEPGGAAGEANDGGRGGASGDGPRDDDESGGQGGAAGDGSVAGSDGDGDASAGTTGTAGTAGDGAAVPPPTGSAGIGGAAPQPVPAPTAAAGASSLAGDAAGANDAGCSCRAAGAQREAPNAAAVISLAVLALFRRRRGARQCT